MEGKRSPVGSVRCGAVRFRAGVWVPCMGNRGGGGRGRGEGEGVVGVASFFVYMGDLFACHSFAPAWLRWKQYCIPITGC